MDPQETSTITSPEPIRQSPSPHSPQLSPQNSQDSARIGTACWPVSVLNSCRQHGWWAYLTGPNSLFFRAHARVDAERPPMFAIAQPKSRAAAPKPNHNVQTQRGFAVRVFKGPTLSSFPYTATAKFDVGYRPTSVNSDPRQAQNWYPARQLASREPPAPARFGSWTENRGGRDTPRPAAAPNYADFIYERSLSSKSDIYSENETSSTTTFTPSSTFSPALSPASTVTSLPSEVPYQSPTTSTSTMNPSSPRHPFPLHIPALAQAQSAIRGLFVHPNGNIGQPQSNRSPTPMPAAPVNRTAELPTSSPPGFFPNPDSPAVRTSPTRAPPLSESPQSAIPPLDYFPPPPSESEVGEAQRLAELNAQQYNCASSSYYQAGFRATDNDQGRFNGGSGVPAREQSPERAAQMGFSSRSVASSSFQEESSDSQAHLVYESSSLGVAGNSAFVNMTTEQTSARFSPTTSQPRVGYVGSESSSTTAVESEARWRDSRARNVPVSQLVEIGSPNPGDREIAERARLMSDPGRYEELRGLNMNILSERQREAYVNAFAPGTQPRGPLIPAVVRSDSGEGTPTMPERTRRNSGNLWSSLSQLPDKRSPVQIPSRPSSTPPLPRIDTSRPTLQAPPPDRRPMANSAGVQQQSPPRRDVPPAQPQPAPQTAPPTSSARTRTPVAGPRVLPAEPQRRRSDGDQPLSSSPSLLKRTSAMLHRSSSPENAAPREASAPRPSRAGALPLDPQRRRSDGFQSVVPPRPRTPVQVTASVAPRNVRWNDNLVCPSPIFPSQRRKGWFNQRGDQLWTNDGAYKPPPQGQEYPPDLRDYPPYGSGWMNEEGVRIDMGHRLIPKAPLRSALKQTQQRGPVIQVNNGN